MDANFREPMSLSFNHVETLLCDRAEQIDSSSDEKQTEENGNEQKLRNKEFAHGVELNRGETD